MAKHSYLRQLRELKNFSQEHISKELEISRPTYMQIEKGERELTISEAQKLSELYGISMPDLIQEVLPSEEPILAPAPGADTQPRVSVPQEKLEKFREVLLYILEKVGAKPNVGETVLYKLLYFIDFDYYEMYEEQLIGAKYQKNTYGPTPVSFAKIIKDMEKKGELTQITNRYFKYQQKKYLPLRPADRTAFSAQEQQVIDSVLSRLSDKSAKELSEYSHNDVPWKVQKMNEILDYEYVFYRDAPYSVRPYDSDPL